MTTTTTTTTAAPAPATDATTPATTSTAAAVSSSSIDDSKQDASRHTSTLASLLKGSLDLTLAGEETYYLTGHEEAHTLTLIPFLTPGW